MDSKRSTIMHVAPTPFFSNRGCHIRIKNIVDALSTQGIQSVICTYHLGDSPPNVDVRRTYPIKAYTKRDAGFSPYKFPADLLLLFLCLKVAWKEKPSVIYGHLHEGVLIGWVVKMVLFWRGIDLVMDMQGSLSGELKAYGTVGETSRAFKLIRWIESIICKLPRKITCSSIESESCLTNQFGINEKVSSCLPDVVGETFFDVCDGLTHKKNLGIPHEQKVVLYSGALLNGKGVEVLYSAMVLLCEMRNDCHFLLIGYPELEAQKFVEANELQARCTLTGEVKYSNLAQNLAVGDVAIDPKAQNSGEASGKILHYMAAGLPVVCFDLPNNRNLLAQNGSYAVDLTAEGLASRIDESLNDLDKEKKKGQLLRKVAERNYSVSTSGKQLLEIFA